jgi:hypothetical protein
MVYVCVQLAIVVLSHAVYLYVHTTVPSHPGGVVEPISTGVTVLPHASVIFPGDPGLTACAGHDTVDIVFAGGVKPPEYVIV